MDEQLSRWSELWTTQSKDHVLVRTGSGDPCPCVIFNVRTRTIDMIEDDELSLRIVDAMRQAGVPVVDRIPTDPDSIDKTVDEMFSAGKSIAEINQKRNEMLQRRCQRFSAGE